MIFSQSKPKKIRGLSEKKDKIPQILFKNAIQSIESDQGQQTPEFREKNDSKSQLRGKETIFHNKRNLKDTNLMKDYKSVK